MLAYLVVTGARHRRDRLCSMLWEVPDDPRGALRWSLSKLRALVDEPEKKRILADRETVGFDPAGAFIDLVDLRQRLSIGPDVMSAEQLTEAAALFRGEFLEGLDLTSCPEFQAWCLAERQELKMLHGGLLGRSIALLATNPEKALPHARTLVALDPFDEAARATLVRLLVETGRREEAEHQYDLSQRMLSEIGAPISAELQRVGRDLRASARMPRSIHLRPNRPESSGVSAAKSEEDSGSHNAGVEPFGSTPATAVRATSAERKQITVLVAILGRPTSLADDDDPETAMQALDIAVEVMRDAVLRHDGEVGAAQPDGLTALFGAPIAHEDHSIRACQAAIAMQAALRDQGGGESSLRIGLHSGEVVVRPVGAGADARYEAVGPVVSLAVQISGLADPGKIVLTGETARRAEGFFQMQPLNSASAANLPQALLVLRGSALRTRWEARAAEGLTPFVGRDDEMEALTRAIRRVEASHGEIVAVIADPGIGKSRLVHEFVRSIGRSEVAVLETSATSQDVKSSYRPVSELLRVWFGVRERDLKSDIERKVRSKIEIFPELHPALPALLSLLDLPVSDGEWPTLSPAQRRRRTLEAVKAVIARECRTRPVVLLVEDLHWIDGETQAVLDQLVDGLVALRLLLLVTHRPEYQHGWTGKSYFSQIRLHPLTAQTAEQLIESLIGSDPSLEALQRELVARTEGTPLFAEETVRALVDADALSGHPGDYRLARSLAHFEIPPTIQAVIAARIDRLFPESKSLLQVASIIGRDVPLALLKRTADLSEDALYEALTALQAAEFLYETRPFPDVEYSFKHALTQEVAYGSVLRERRRAIHVEIVRTIEMLAEERIDEHVERLAHHAVQGRLSDQAVQYLYRAAKKALQRSAHGQALEFLRHGLELIPNLPETHGRLQMELNYQKMIGVALMAARGWGAQEVSNAYQRARSLAEELGDDRELFVVLRGQGQFHMIRGEVRIARELGDRCIALAQGSVDPALHIETHHLFWSNSFFMGDYAGAGHHSDRGMALYDRHRDHRLTYVYSGHDPGVCCRCFSGLVLWEQGDSDRALVRCREALDLAIEIGHPLTTALAYWSLCYVNMLRREPVEAQRAAEREIAICEEYVLPLLLSQGQFQLGWSLAAQGTIGDGLDLMRKGLEDISATGAEMGRPYFSALYAEALAQAGRPKDGLAEIERALHVVETKGARLQLPEILRLKGEVLKLLPHYDADAATACFRDAMATARTQGARLWSCGLRQALRAC